MLDTHKISKFGVWEMPFPAFSAGHFLQINTYENAVVSCLFYPSLVLSARHSVFASAFCSYQLAK